MQELDSDIKDAVGERILRWYATAKRDMPWRRRTHDPYAIWVSEIMLQQTTVATVGPYYERWLAAFPTVGHLAAAPLDDVLKLWAGLGYYARARNLHRAAQRVVNEFDGLVPRDPKTLRSLPGIGPYTAGAILSVAYNADEPIVDTNVVRVLSRLFVVGGDPKSSAVSRALWKYARALIPTGRASDFNQGLMELGALVCEPASPRCGACPLSDLCLAHRTGADPTAYPELKRKDALIPVDDVAVVLRNENGELALGKRPASAGLWGGLWELPRATRGIGEGLAECAARALRDGLGMEAATLRLFATVSHVVTKRKITLHGFMADGTRSIGELATDNFETGIGVDSTIRVVRETGDGYTSQSTQQSMRGVTRYSLCGPTENEAVSDALDWAPISGHGRPPLYEETAWVAGRDASRFAMASPQVRLIEALLRFEEQGQLFDLRELPAEEGA